MQYSAWEFFLDTDKLSRIHVLQQLYCQQAIERIPLSDLIQDLLRNQVVELESYDKGGFGRGYLTCIKGYEMVGEIHMLELVASVNY